MEKVSKSKTVKFWNWFTESQSLLVPGKITPEFINILNERILELGDFNWEIREGKHKNYMLIISPGGDLDLLQDTYTIINLAPELDNWEFIHYKPAKKWDFKLTMKPNSKINKKEVDVKKWEYILLDFSDGTYDIIIKADNLKLFNDNEKLTIADIVLESILGEELSLRLIKKVEFLEEFDKSDENKKNSIQVLKEHLAQLIG